MNSVESVTEVEFSAPEELFFSTMMKWKHQKSDCSGGDSDVESSLAVLDRVLSEFDDIETDSVFDGEGGSHLRSIAMDEDCHRSSQAGGRRPPAAGVSSSVPPPPVDRSTKPRPGSAGGTPAASWRSNKSSADHSTARSSAASAGRAADSDDRPGPELARRSSSRVNGLVRSFEAPRDSRESSPPHTGPARTSGSQQRTRPASEARPRRTQSETRFGDSVAMRAAVAPPSLTRHIGPPPSTRPPPPPPPSQEPPWSAAGWQGAAARRPAAGERAGRTRQRAPVSETPIPPPLMAAVSRPNLPPLPTKVMLRQKSSPHINYQPPADPRRRSLPARDTPTGIPTPSEHSSIESKIKRLSLNFEPNGPVRAQSRLTADFRMDRLEQRIPPERVTEIPLPMRASSRERSPSPNTTGRGRRFSSSHPSPDPAIPADSPGALQPAGKPPEPPLTSQEAARLTSPGREMAAVVGSSGDDPQHAALTPPDTTPTNGGAAAAGDGDVTVTSEAADEEQKPSLPAKQHSARSRDERRPPARRKRDRKRQSDATPPPPEEAQKQISQLLTRGGSQADTPTSTLYGSASTLGSSASTPVAGSGGRPRPVRRSTAENRLRPSRPAPSPPIQRQTSSPAIPTSGSLSSRHSDNSGQRGSQSFRATPLDGKSRGLRRADASVQDTGSIESGTSERVVEREENGTSFGEVTFDLEGSGQRTFNYVSYREDSGSGPVSLPPSLGIDDSSQPSNSFPKKMPLFSPIVKDRLNDNTNMYIPAPPSPRPDYYDSELSETDSLTREGSENESLFALKDKRAGKASSGLKLGANKISPPMHRKNKVKESKERHKSKQKEKTPEMVTKEVVPKSEAKLKKDKKSPALSARQLSSPSVASSKAPSPVSRRFSHPPRAPSTKSPAPKAPLSPKQSPALQKLDSPPKKRSSFPRPPSMQNHPSLSKQISVPVKMSSSRKQPVSPKPAATKSTSSPKPAASRTVNSPKPAGVGSASSPRSATRSSLSSVKSRVRATASTPKPEPVNSSPSHEITPDPPEGPHRKELSIELLPVDPKDLVSSAYKQHEEQSPLESRRHIVSVDTLEVFTSSQAVESPPDATALREPPPPAPPVVPSVLTSELGPMITPAESEESPLKSEDSEPTVATKTPLQAMIEDFHKNLPPPPAFDDVLNVSMDEPVSLAEEVDMEPDDSYYSDDSLDDAETGGERKKRSARRRRRKSDWSTTTSFDYVHRKEARKKIPEKLTHRDEGISSLESHNSASDDNDVSRKASRASAKNFAAVEMVSELVQLEQKLAKVELSNGGKSKSKFDSIRKLLKEGRLEGLETPPPDFVPPPPPVVASASATKPDVQSSPAQGADVVKVRSRDSEKSARPRSHSQPAANLLEPSAGRDRSSESPRQPRTSHSFIHQTSKSSLFVDYRRPSSGSPAGSSGRRRAAPRPDPAARLRSERPERCESPLRRNRPVRPPEGAQVNPLTHARPGVPLSPLAGLHSAESLHSSLPPVLRSSAGKGTGPRGHLTLPGERAAEKRDVRRADSLSVHKKEKEGDSKFKFSIFKGFWRRKQYSLEQV